MKRTAAPVRCVDGASTSTACGAVQPAFKFGAIADVQYADVDDAWNYKRTAMRGYRGSLLVLRGAVEEWLQGPSLDFVADLGDIIDQQCETKGESCGSLERVLEEWTPLAHVPVVRLVGNHELYNFSRADCARLIPHITPWYRSFTPAKGWRVVVLDPFDVNVIEKGGGKAVEEGMEYLSRFNPNDLRAPRGTVDLSVGLDGLQRRFVPMGGGMSEPQLQWLRCELHAARQACEQVVILTHLPLHPDATVPGALLWNYDEVLADIRAAQGTVALVLAGHYHNGGYVEDEGVHHVVLPSPLHACQEELRAHCTVEVWEDRLELVGRGIVPSRTLALQERPRESSDARAVDDARL